MAENIDKIYGDLESTPDNSIKHSFEKDGITKEIEVKEAENGFVVYVSEHGYKDEEWYSAKQIYISTTNPLEDDENEEDNTKINFKATLKNALDNLTL